LTTFIESFCLQTEELYPVLTILIIESASFSIQICTWIASKPDPNDFHGFRSGKKVWIFKYSTRTHKAALKEILSTLKRQEKMKTMPGQRG